MAHTIHCSHDDCPESSTTASFKPKPREQQAADHRRPWVERCRGPRLLPRSQLLPTRRLTAARIRLAARKENPVYRIAIIRKGQPADRRTCGDRIGELLNIVFETIRAEGSTITDADHGPLTQLAGDARSMADTEGFAALEFGNAAITIRPGPAPAPTFPGGGFRPPPYAQPTATKGPAVISKSGRYWSTGITVTWAPLAERIHDEPYSGWHAKLDYSDDGFADNNPDAGQVSTEGTLYTRYPVRNAKIRSGLAVALDVLLADAKRLGIEFTAAGPDSKPWLYYRGDGEDAEHPPPDGWRQTLAAEAERIGFRSYATPAA